MYQIPHQREKAIYAAGENPSFDSNINSGRFSIMTNAYLVDISEMFLIGVVYQMLC